MKYEEDFSLRYKPGAVIRRRREETFRVSDDVIDVEVLCAKKLAKGDNDDSSQQPSR